MRRFEEFRLSPERREWLVRRGGALLALLVVIDLLAPRHPYFGWDAVPGAYAALALAAVAATVAVARAALGLLGRREDYPDDRPAGGEGPDA